jgi:hypothetical protein
MATARAESRKRVAIYLRVSTTGQTTTNQQRELEAVANRHGWQVVQVFADNGVSGAKGRKDRPGLDTLLKAWPGGTSIWSRPGRSIASGDHCRI